MFTVGLLTKNWGTQSTTMLLRWHYMGQSSMFSWRGSIWLDEEALLTCPCLQFIIYFSSINSRNILITRFTMIIIDIDIAPVVMYNQYMRFYYTIVSILVKINMDLTSKVLSNDFTVTIGHKIQLEQVHPADRVCCPSIFFFRFSLLQGSLN